MVNDTFGTQFIDNSPCVYRNVMMDVEQCQAV
jgi:hypothetical protein